MRKFLSQVVAMLLVALIAAPAAMAQAEKALSPLAKETVISGKLEQPSFKIPKAKEIGLEKTTQIRHSVSATDAKAFMNRRNAAKFAPSFASGAESFNAVVIFQDGMQYVSEIQMYEFSAKAPCTSEVQSMWSIQGGATYGAVMGEEYYYVTDARVQSGEANLIMGKVYNPETWELVDEVELTDLSCLMFAAAYDPTTGNIYANGYKADGQGLQFGVFDPETFTISHIADQADNYSAFSCGLDGTLYAIDFDGNFGTINKTNGEFTLIKETGLSCGFYTSGAINYMAPKPTFYYAVLTEEQADLYAIDCATGEYAHVYEFDNGQELRGMYFERPAAEETAPAKATLTAVEFVGQALTGTVTFTTPATLYNGSNAPAGQTLRYEVVANGKVIQSGSNLEYGHTYKIKVDVDAAGLYNFNVLVYNEVGPGPKSNKIVKWVGPDTPAQAKNVKATWADGKMTVAWDAVTTGAHDGAIGNVTYALYNAVDSTLIKDALTATTYTLDVKEPVEYTEFQYYVIATCDGEDSEPALSNVVALGNFVAPFATAVNSAATPDWTVIDANGDNKTWKMMADAAQYTYNSSKDADDWLITSPIVVKKGYLYTVTIKARVQSATYPETFEVKAGAAATAEAMTIDVIEPTTIKTTAYTAYTGSFIAESDLVYVGIHGISAKNMYYLLVNEFSIDGGVNSAAPAPATDLNVLVPYSGENKATLSYTTPTVTVAGDELTGAKALTRVEVLVNDKLQYVDNKPTAGAMSSIEIDVPTFGVYNFQVISYNASGAGEIAEISAYVGINVPADVTNAKVVEVSDGVVNVSWDAVTMDVDGSVMNPALVKYTVVYPYYDKAGQLAVDVVAENITETAINNIEVVKADEQEFVQYIIYAVTEAGESEGTVTEAVAVGTPYALPYNETFANGGLDHIYITAHDTWTIFNDASGIVSRNKDNGFIACQTPFIEFWGMLLPIGEAYGEIISGKIAVTEQDPELSFYYFAFGADNTNTITTKVICDGDTVAVNEVVTAGNNEWKRNVVDMKAYAGKTVQLLFASTLNKTFMGSGYHGFIDDIRLGDPVKVDVVAKSISAPSTVTTEKAFKVDYTVFNQGTSEAKNVFVSLYANGNLVESSVDTLTIAAGETITGTFDQEAFNLFEAGTYKFSYVVDCEADQDLTNNTSDVVTVTVANTNLPSLQLSGSEDIVKEDSTATVKLEWDVPAIDVSSMEVVESFESASYPAFTTDNFGGWTLLNYNDTPTYGFKGIEFPNAGTAFGWILFDAGELGLLENEDVKALWPYEGSCYMAAFAHETGANDAWLVSPNMAGLAQTVTFYAKANTSQYGPETMECYVSSTGMDKADFTKVTIQGYDAANGVPDTEWTKYSIELPAGTQYFAIRSTASDTFMLMVDNIQYQYSSPFMNLELKGYDVYRNQVKITNAPLTVEEYTDVVKQNGTYDYTVVAVYNEGNSAPSNVYSVTVDFTQVGIADAVAGVKVAVEGREIVVTGAEEVTIAAVDGKLVYAGESARVAVAAGVYVVKADDTVAKVIVK